MNPFLMSQLMDFPAGDATTFGQNNPFFGSMDSLLGGQFGMMMGLMGDLDIHETGPVEEITVDDFFNSLIEALDNDKDVFEYQSDTYSHPLFGKMVRLDVVLNSVLFMLLFLVYGRIQPL